jgi:hypothetical protein
VTLSNGLVVSNPLATPIRFAYGERAIGQFELPALQVLSVRVGYGVALRSAKLAIALDVLNVTNAGADQALAPGGNQIFSTAFGKGHQPAVSTRDAPLRARVVLNAFQPA